MKFLDFKTSFDEFPSVSLAEIRKLEPDFDLRRLSEWQQKGYIRKVCRGHYLFADSKLDERALFTIANRIYPPSYVSLETAFSLYGVIPEAVYSISSISSRKTKTLRTPVGDFVFRHVKPELLFGFILSGVGTQASYKVASLEKALLD